MKGYSIRYSQTTAEIGEHVNRRESSAARRQQESVVQGTCGRVRRAGPRRVAEAGLETVDLTDWPTIRAIDQRPGDDMLCNGRWRTIRDIVAYRDNWIDEATMARRSGNDGWIYRLS